MLAAYGDFFAHKLDKFLLDDAVPPLERMAAFVRHAGQGMEKFQFRRGCTVGNLLQEAPLLPGTFPQRLMAITAAWGRAWRACAKRRQPGHRQRRLTAGAGPSVLDRLGRRGDARRAGPVCRTA